VSPEIGQIIHKKTHDLARYYLEVGANFKQFRTATAHVSEALTRLKDLRANYEQGKTPLGPYLDSVARWSEATSTEADFKARYNTSIASVERAKGTLLDHDRIALATPHDAP
jgi:outer membrane protein TolC